MAGNLLVWSHLQYETNLYNKSWGGNYLMWSDFNLGTLLQGQMRIAKLKILITSLIIGRTGLGW